MYSVKGMCVCVCVMVSSGSDGCSISMGPVMRLVHPITSPFAASPFKGRSWPGPFPPISRTWYHGRNDRIASGSRS